MPTYPRFVVMPTGVITRQGGTTITFRSFAKAGKSGMEVQLELWWSVTLIAYVSKKKSFPCRNAVVVVALRPSQQCHNITPILDAKFLQQHILSMEEDEGQEVFVSYSEGSLAPLAVKGVIIFCNLRYSSSSSQTCRTAQVHSIPMTIQTLTSLFAVAGTSSIFKEFLNIEHSSALFQLLVNADQKCKVGSLFWYGSGLTVQCIQCSTCLKPCQCKNANLVKRLGQKVPVVFTEISSRF